MQSLTTEKTLTSLQNPLVPLRLHDTKGSNVWFVNKNDGFATRVNVKSGDGYIFTAYPVSPEQTIVVQILSQESAGVCSNNTLSIGLTARDPATLRPDLSDFARKHFDCRQYWEVGRISLLRIGEAVAFTLTNGQVQLSRNGSTPETVLRVDQRIPLWAFVEMCGSIKTIRMLSRGPVVQPALNLPQHLRGTSESAASLFKTHNEIAFTRKPKISTMELTLLKERNQYLKRRTEELHAYLGINQKPTAVRTHNVPSTSRHQPVHPVIEEAPSTSSPSSTPDELPPIRFNSVQERNAWLSGDTRSTKTTRKGPCFQGLAFSDRSVQVNEKVYLRFMKISKRRHGFIILGFTRHNPAISQQDPTLVHALPELTSKPGNWVQALENRLFRKKDTLYFFVNSSGNVYYGINEEEKGLFFSGVDTSTPLWAVADVYGNITTVQFIHGTVPHQIRKTNPPKEVELTRNMSTLTVEESLPQIKYQKPIVPLSDEAKGSNFQLDNKRIGAANTDVSINQGYIFNSQPMRPGEIITVLIYDTQCADAGGLTFGLTSCDPDTIRSLELPDIAEDLLDRPEYWVVKRDAAEDLETGDELAFTMTSDGQVQLSRNGSNAVTIMHVDYTVTLWAFVHICGHLKDIMMFSSVPEIQPVISPQQSKFSSESAVPKDTSKPRPEGILNEPSTSQQPIHTVEDNQADTECTICCENPADSVLYTCGHLCMCYKCAVQQWKGRGGGKCPLCRTAIKDVIRMYRS